MTKPLAAALAGAADLRQVLRLVDAGEVYADSAKARTVLRQVEGAVLALEALAADGADIAAAVDAGQVLRALLDLVAVGDMKADSSRAVALTYRLEGATTALESLAYSSDLQ